MRRLSRHSWSDLPATADEAADSDAQLQPKFEISPLFPHTVDADDAILSMDCQGGILALLTSRGRLRVHDLEEDRELFEATVRNPYRVYVHPLGSHVVAAALDGDLYYFPTYDAARSATVNLDPQAAAFASVPLARVEDADDASGGGGGGGGAAGPSPESRRGVLVAESLAWLPTPPQPSSLSRSPSASVEVAACLVGARGGGWVVAVSWEQRGVRMRGRPRPLLRLPLADALVPIAGLCVVAAADATGGTTVLLSTSTQLFTARGAAGPLALMEALAAGDAALAVRAAPAADVEAAAAHGGLVAFRPHAEAPAQSFAWASAYGVVHGLMDRGEATAATAVRGGGPASEKRGEEAVAPSSLVNVQMLPLGAGLQRDAAADMAAQAELLPLQAPTQVCLTAFHMVLLYPHRLIVLQHPAGLTWRAWATTGEGDASDSASAKVSLTEVLARIRFDPFRGLRHMAEPLRGVVRDASERRLFVFSRREVWELTVEHEHRQQWRVFLERAINPHETTALRRRFYDAAYRLAEPSPAARSTVQFRRGCFYLDQGDVDRATSLLATCDDFDEVFLHLSERDAGERGRWRQPALGVYLEKRFRFLANCRTSRGALLPQLMALLTFGVAQKLDAISAADGPEEEAAASEDLDRFLQDAVVAARDLFQEQPFVDLLMQQMQSQGSADNACALSMLLGHYGDVVTYRTARGDVDGALEVLTAHCTETAMAELWFTQGPLLVRERPVRLLRGIAALLRRAESVGGPPMDEARFIATFMEYDPARNEEGPTSTHHVIQLLEACCVLGGDMGRCRSRAVHHYYAELLVEYGDKERLDRFLARSRDYDAGFLLRLCLAKELYPQCVVLYQRLGFLEDAVRAAMRSLATAPPAQLAAALESVETLLLLGAEEQRVEPHVLKRLWLELAEAVIAQRNSRAALGVVERSNGMLQLQDILGSVEDSAVVQELKDAIRRALDRYTGAIAELHQKREEIYMTSVAVTQELEDLRHQFGYVSTRQRCPLCRELLSFSHQPYLVYPACGHVVHESCALQRLESIGGLRAFLSEEGQPRHFLAGVQTTEDLANADCVICGEAAIIEVGVPLMEPDRSWDV